MYFLKIRITKLDLNLFLMALGIILSLYFHVSTQNNIANRDKKNIENERNNIRTMFAYEISYNQSNLRLLNSTKTAGFNYDACQDEACEPSAVELNSFANIRLNILNTLRDDVYTIYLPKIYLLDQNEVSLIMNYYYSQKSLMNNSIDIQKELPKNRNNKKWLEQKTDILNHAFENEYSLGEEILRMYKTHVPKEALDKL
ncbi:hypothetical protein [Providencia rettgeri]|uniref:hypothetical protein n=1 Tax=Providencia rettgeri TaxID=587 RepID=UPI001B371954|nr:hypothetical protein [Providencia rettgeri]MBQ0366766.1 hypothetical protein [Providencia rettgeri]